MVEFAVWNYFTDDRANTTDFYSEGNLYWDSIETDLTVSDVPAQNTLSTKYLTSRYVEFLFAGDWGEDYMFEIKVTPLSSGAFVNSMIFYNDPNDYKWVHSFRFRWRKHSFGKNMGKKRFLFHHAAVPPVLSIIFLLKLI